MPVKQVASLGLSLIWVLPVLAVLSVVVAVAGPHLFDPVRVENETVTIVKHRERWGGPERRWDAAISHDDLRRAVEVDEDGEVVSRPTDDGASAPKRGNFRVRTPDGEFMFEVSKEAVRLKVGDWDWTHAHPEGDDAAPTVAVEPQPVLGSAEALPVVAEAPEESGAPALAAESQPVDTNEVEADVALLRPRWMDGVVDQPDHIVVEGSPKVTPEEAITSVYAKAAERLKEELGKVYGEHGSWTLPIDVVRDHAVDDLYVEPYKVVTAGEPQGIMTNRAFAVVSLEPAVKRQLYLTWREQIVERRLWAFGGVFALATLIVTTSAGYLRLDTLSHGAYRRRLKLAAVSLIVAGGLALAAVLPQV